MTDPRPYEEFLIEQLAELTQQIRDLNVIPDDPASTLTKLSLEARSTAINQELDKLAVRALELRLVGEMTSDGVMATSALRQLLGRVQGYLDWSTYADFAGRGVSGSIPARFKRMAATETYGLQPASFRFGLRHISEGEQAAVPVEQVALNVDTPQAFEKSASDLIQMIAAASDAEFDSDLEETVRKIGPKAANQVRLIADLLANLDLDLEIGLVGRSIARIDAPVAAEFRDWLGQVEEFFDERTVTGPVTVADSERGRFGIRVSEEELIEGHAAKDLIRGLVNGEIYTLTLQVRIETGDHTNVQSEKAQLIRIESGPSSAGK